MTLAGCSGFSLWSAGAGRSIVRYSPWFLSVISAPTSSTFRLRGQLWALRGGLGQANRNAEHGQAWGHLEPPPV